MPLSRKKTSVPKKEKAPSPRDLKSPSALAPGTAGSVGIPAAPRLDVDFPREGEEILPGHYAVRVSAEGAEGVELSVNGGSWQPCRSAVGFFWYDWAPAEAGTHVISVRWRKGKLRSKPLALRNCSVKEANLN